ncbi:Histone deacetylase hda1 [Tulasnella sp. 403]|nr:Histone deacetylase hda1 [Tulasnella sp. 403]
MSEAPGGGPTIGYKALEERVGGGGPLVRTPRVGYVYDTRMMGHAEIPRGTEHDDDDTHPEQPQRIERIDRCLQEGGCREQMHLLAIRHMRKDEALLVHSEDHWDKVAAIQYLDIEAIQSSRAYYEHLSLYVHPNTPEAALLSAGGVIEAALAVARGEVKTSFANVRPPGHHAEPEEHMGFCFFNNVAVAAKVVQLETSIKKIMILDWDVHHGNGTQRTFNDDPSVLYVSIHRYDDGTFYPTGPFGGMDSCGEGPGLGTSVNIPWPTGGMQDADYLYAFMRIVMPIAYEFAPELVIISAGFDAADGDDLGECHVSPAGYAHMTHMLTCLAGGKVVVALEGGYNLTSISTSALAVAEILLGNPPPLLPQLTASEYATEAVWQVARIQSRFWKCIDPKALEPKEEYGDDAVSVPDILKAYRVQDMLRKMELFALPFADEALQEAFDNQVLCTSDIWKQKCVLVFLHDYGSLRAELEGATHVDMSLEKSYILGVTDPLLDWLKSEEFGLLDINVFPHKLRTGSTELSLTNHLITYLWDNYVELLETATDIVLLASGHACKLVPEILRTRDFDKKLRAIVQVIGGVDLPRNQFPDADKRRWFIKHSLVVIPEDHPRRLDMKFPNTYGRVQTVGTERPSIGLTQAIPLIKDFVREMIAEARQASVPPSTTSSVNGVLSHD